MLVVLAYAHDWAARTLVERLRAMGEEAGLLTCADLSRRGWSLRAGDLDAGRAVIEGERLPNADIRAVLVRMPAAAETELPHVDERDRAYAAAEMHAFLLAWLSQLRCPVLNRATPNNLGGPSWHTADWVLRARRLGIAARPVVWKSSFAAPRSPEIGSATPSTRYVDVVGESAFLLGGREPRSDELPFARAAIQLARDAGVEVMRAYFDAMDDGAPRFLEAGLWVDLSADAVVDAITERCFGYVHARPGAGAELVGMASA